MIWNKLTWLALILVFLLSSASASLAEDSAAKINVSVDVLPATILKMTEAGTVMVQSNVPYELVVSGKVITGKPGVHYYQIKDRNVVLLTKVE